jgi:hypothetical protein
MEAGFRNAFMIFMSVSITLPVVDVASRLRLRGNLEFPGSVLIADKWQRVTRTPRQHEHTGGWQSLGATLSLGAFVAPPYRSWQKYVYNYCPRCSSRSTCEGDSILRLILAFSSASSF